VTGPRVGITLCTCPCACPGWTGPGGTREVAETEAAAIEEAETEMAVAAAVAAETEAVARVAARGAAGTEVG